MYEKLNTIAQQRKILSYMSYIVYIVPYVICIKDASDILTASHRHYDDMRTGRPSFTYKNREYFIKYTKFARRVPTYMSADILLLVFFFCNFLCAADNIAAAALPNNNIIHIN